MWVDGVYSRALYTAESEEYCGVTQIGTNLDDGPLTRSVLSKIVKTSCRWPPIPIQIWPDPIECRPKITGIAQSEALVYKICSVTPIQVTRSSKNAIHVIA